MWENVPEDLCRWHPKRRIGEQGPSNPSFGVTYRLQNIVCEGSRVQFYSRCHTKRRNGGGPPAKSFFGYNDKDLEEHFPMTQLACLRWATCNLGSMYISTKLWARHRKKCLDKLISTLADPRNTWSGFLNVLPFAFPSVYPLFIALY